MEFWGVEVKAGQPLKVKPDDEEMIHVSQATLGESQKKGDGSVPIYVKYGDKKLVLGTLSADKFPQVSFDLVFEKEFELSHNWNGGSVYFMGYKMAASEEDDFSDMGTDSEEDDLPINLEENGKVAPGPVTAKPALGNANAVKAKKSAEKPKVSAEAAKGKEKGGDSDEDDDDDEDGSAEDDSDDEEGTDSEIDSDDDEEDSDEDDEEETPKKAVVGKKRSIDSASKTPDAKKAKLASPQKTDGKKGGHTATPHPAKQGAKNPASNKKQQQTPKSGGSVTCNSCSKTFNSESALQSHSKAKHGAK